MDTTSLPTGTVTFLLTDIEGSTRLWEQNPDAMRHALTRHHALLTAGIEQHGGGVIKSQGEGDSFLAVFTHPADALSAASALQQALTAEHWPTETPLRVRMALHTGEAELRDGDYYGPTVNRCARLRAVAHGGQVLLSEATVDRIRGHLAEGVSLRDLGAHRLKDLQQPERLFQLLHLVPSPHGSWLRSPPVRAHGSLEARGSSLRSRARCAVRQRAAVTPGAGRQRSPLECRRSGLANSDARTHRYWRAPFDDTLKGVHRRPAGVPTAAA